MFQKVAWPVIIAVVLVLLALIQILRVNQPKSPVSEKVEQLYTSNGPIFNGTITIQPRDFFSKRINLNRRLKLTGTFRTADLRSVVSTLVIDEQHLEQWKLGSEDLKYLSQTGYVPGGKVSLVLEPGVYLLVIDNREHDESRTVQADFQLE